MLILSSSHRRIIVVVVVLVVAFAYKYHFKFRINAVRTTAFAVNRFTNLIYNIRCTYVARKSPKRQRGTEKKNKRFNLCVRHIIKTCAETHMRLNNECGAPAARMTIDLISFEIGFN